MIRPFTETIYLNIAGFVIKIVFQAAEALSFFKNNLKREIISTYREFILSDQPQSDSVDYLIQFSEIDHRIFKFKKNNYQEFMTVFTKQVRKREVNTYYYISLSMFIHILNFLLIELLSENNGFCLHASASNFKEKAIIFTGDSEAGKSTAMKLLNNKYEALSDDKIFIKKENKAFYFYQSSFFAKNTWIKRGRKRYPIGKIFFLKKRPYFKLEKLRNKDKIFQMVTKQIVALDPKILEKSIKNLSSFIKTFENFYLLYFDKDKKGMIEFFESHQI